MRKKDNLYIDNLLCILYLKNLLYCIYINLFYNLYLNIVVRFKFSSSNTSI